MRSLVWLFGLLLFFSSALKGCGGVWENIRPTEHQHAFSERESWTEERTENGVTTVITTWVYTCPECGAHYTETEEEIRETVPEMTSAMPEPSGEGREETDAPPETDSGEDDRAETAESRESSEADLSQTAAFWNGTWYGAICLGEGCSGLYSFLKGKSYTVYVTVSLDKTGRGRFALYDPEGTFGELLAEGACTAEGTDRLLIESAEVAVLSLTGSGLVFPYDETERLVRAEFLSSQRTGTLAGKVLLRRWGERWDDVPQYRDLLPDYENYLAELTDPGGPPYSTWAEPAN